MLTFPKSFPTLFSLVFLFYSLLAFPGTSLQCNPNDQNVLLKIKSHFNAPDESALTGWDTKQSNCCSWSGIQCNAKGRVTSLSIVLQSNTPYNIPTVVGDLPFLQSLRLTQFGSLFGPIPLSITKLNNLESLDFSHNNLTGPIPDFLAQLTHLTYLDLSDNKLSGSIPSSLGKLSNLQKLDLSVNHLTGSVPDFLGQLIQLTYLDLSGNSLSGPIPSTLGKLTNLQTLILVANHLSGSIPPSLSHLTKLTTLDLHSNHLTGSIPGTFGSFNNADMLLSVSDNRLSGPLPHEFGKVNVYVLDLSRNKFTGDASFLFGRGKNFMQSVFMSENEFEFDFSKVEFPIGLRDLVIKKNKIYGSLPKQLGQLPLKTLDVSYNRLCGPIPTGRRLKRFNPDLFAHNKCLCGAPLPPCK